MNGQINDQSWKQLYDKAIALKKAKPWQWMDSGQIFAIEDPITKINYYCSVYGSNSFDSIQMLIGEEGLNRCLCTTVDPELEAAYSAKGQITLAAFLAPFDEYSYQCNFCNLTDLEENEHQRIKKLGYNFRGAKQWVAFQATVPGEVPRDLHTPEEVALVTRILEQMSTIVLAEKNKSMIADFLDPNMPLRDIFHWYYDQARNQWAYDFLKATDLIEKIPNYKYSNQLLIRKVSKLKYNQKAYEMIRIFIPKPIKEDDHFYFPVMFMLMDLDMGVIVWDHLDMMRNEKLGEDLINNLAKFFIQQGSKPAQILSADMAVQELICNFCTETRISNEFLEETIIGNDLINDFLDFQYKMETDEEFSEAEDYDPEEMIQFLQEILESEENPFEQDILSLLQSTKKQTPPKSPKNTSKSSNLIDLSTHRAKDKEPKQ